MNLTPVLVTGAAGQLGHELGLLLGDSAVMLTRSDLDITDRAAIERAAERHRPSAIINCAAYTAVDRAESEPHQCDSINADAVESLAATCRQFDCTLVQISSDYVFGCSHVREHPFRETDHPEPAGVYACSKWKGEVLASQWAKHYVVRTCGLYSHFGNNFVKTMLRLAHDRDHLRVVNDQHCTPSNAADVAKAVVFLLGTDAFGTYHVVNSGATTWFDFAREIFRLAKIDMNVEPITSEQYSAPAPRPRFSLLDTTKYHGLSGPPMPHWRDALARHMSRYDPG